MEHFYLPKRWLNQLLWLSPTEACTIWKPMSDKMWRSASPNNWQYFCLHQSPDKCGVPFTIEEVPIFLKDVISPEELSRLSKSVLQIRVNPRSTIIQLSPRYGVMSLQKMTRIYKENNFLSQFATAAVHSEVTKKCESAVWIPSASGLQIRLPDAENDALKEYFSYPFKYNYEHLKNWHYKERDVYGLTNKDDNQQNDLAFTTFSRVLAPDWQPSDVQDFFVPTSKTWSLHKTDAFIFAYPSQSKKCHEDWLKFQGKDTETINRILPGNKKVMKQGKVLFRRPKDERVEHTMPPIVGIHSCGAYDGMEGGAIVSIKYPGELIGIHVSGVNFTNDPKDARFNLFVSVHHPRFVKFYAEKVVNDLQKRAKPFLMRNLDKIRAYLTLHGYTIEVVDTRADTFQVRVMDAYKNEIDMQPDRYEREGYEFLYARTDIAIPAKRRTTLNMTKIVINK